jgi:succinoglycan biosynthesis transport protein ExoP
MEAPAVPVSEPPAGLVRRPSWARMRRALLGAIGAAGAGVLVRALMSRPGRTVRTGDDLSLLAGVGVIGIIPAFRASGKAVHGRARPDASAMRAYRALRSALDDGRHANGARVIVITSARSGDGKTTSAANLAVVMATHGDRVLLIDAETRRGDQHALFGVAAEPGFFDLLFGQATANACIRTISVGPSARLDLLPSGGASQTDAESLLIAGRLGGFLGRLRADYDVVLIDSPPLDSYADAARIGAHADAVVFVARAGHTPRRSVEAAARQLRHVGAMVVGAVLNDVSRRR